MDGQDRKEETFVLETLKKYFQEDKYQGLVKIPKQDRPDLRNDEFKYGIEVRLACYSETKAMEEILHPQKKHCLHDSHSNNSMPAKEFIDIKLKKYHGESIYTDNILIGFSTSIRCDESFSILQKAINEKHSKLESYLQENPNYTIDLCIVDQLDYNSIFSFNNTCIKVCKEYREKFLSQNTYFSKIFVIKNNYNSHQLVTSYDVKDNHFSLLSFPPQELMTEI